MDHIRTSLLLARQTFGPGLDTNSWCSRSRYMLCGSPLLDCFENISFYLSEIQWRCNPRTVFWVPAMEACLWLQLNDAYRIFLKYFLVKCAWDDFWMSFGCFLDVLGMSFGCHLGVFWMPFGFSWMFFGCLLDVFWICWVCFGFIGCLWDVSEMYFGCFFGCLLDAFCFFLDVFGYLLGLHGPSEYLEFGSNS